MCTFWNETYNVTYKQLVINVQNSYWHVLYILQSFISMCKLVVYFEEPFPCLNMLYISFNHVHVRACCRLWLACKRSHVGRKYPANWLFKVPIVFKATYNAYLGKKIAKINIDLITCSTNCLHSRPSKWPPGGQPFINVVLASSTTIQFLFLFTNSSLTQTKPILKLNSYFNHLPKPP